LGREKSKKTILQQEAGNHTLFKPELKNNKPITLKPMRAIINKK
jgi:hypothetical protein